MNIIEARDLVKVYQIVERGQGVVGAIRTMFSRKFRKVRAVDGVSFTIREGEMVGYVGPNGAGKSTTIKMLTGVLVPTSGELLVNGRVPYRARMDHATCIGVVFGQRSQLWWDLPARESFGALRAIYRIPGDTFRANLRYLSNMLELGPLLDQPVRQMSLGQRMRCELAASLLHSPTLLFLDEPTIGLDLLAKERLREAIKEINRRNGTTVILTTHNLDDVETICRRIIVIDRGRIVYDGTLDQMRQRYGGEHVLAFDIRDGCDGTDQLLQNLQTLPGIVETRGHDHTLIVTFNHNVITPPKIVEHVMQSSVVQDFRLSETPIETVIKQIYQEASTNSLGDAHCAALRLSGGPNV